MKSAGKEEAEMSQFMSSLQYSDSSGRTPVADARTQRRPSQGFGKVVDLGAELKQSAGFEEKLSGQVSPGRTQDFLISALLNEETANPGGGPGKPPLAPGAKPKMPKAETTEEERSATPEGQAMKARLQGVDGPSCGPGAVGRAAVGELSDINQGLHMLWVCLAIGELSMG
eukprot:g31985.t1